MISCKQQYTICIAKNSRDMLVLTPSTPQRGSANLFKADGSVWKTITAQEHDDLINGRPVTVPMFTGIGVSVTKYR